MAAGGQENTDDAQIEADVVPVTARVGGAVLHVLVRENQAVKKGEALLKLDPADFAARLKQAEPEVTTAKAQAAMADAQVQIVEAATRCGFATARSPVLGLQRRGVLGRSQHRRRPRHAGPSRGRRQESPTRPRAAKKLKAANAVPQERVNDAQAARDATFGDTAGRSGPTRGGRGVEPDRNLPSRGAVDLPAHRPDSCLLRGRIPPHFASSGIALR